MNFTLTWQHRADPYCCGLIHIGMFELQCATPEDKVAFKLSGYTYPSEASDSTVRQFIAKLNELPYGRLIQCTTRSSAPGSGWWYINSVLIKAGFVQRVDFLNANSGNKVILWTYKT